MDFPFRFMSASRATGRPVAITSEATDDAPELASVDPGAGTNSA
jgi:high-affinity K+ transport system ATPase subunit B